MRVLKLTRALRAQLDRVDRASGLYPNEDDGYTPLDLEKLKLADLVLAAAREARTTTPRLPARAVPVVVHCELRPRRRPA